jgi:signal transduction histidine kinase
LGQEFADRSGVVTVVDVNEQVASELASRGADIVQIVREALSNVGRHADATTCRVRLQRNRDGHVILEIDDDGSGFDATTPAAGMGLSNLRERATSLGGTLQIESSPSQGSTVRVTLTR